MLIPSLGKKKKKIAHSLVVAINQLIWEMLFTCLFVFLSQIVKNTGSSSSLGVGGFTPLFKAMTNLLISVILQYSETSVTLRPL